MSGDAIAAEPMLSRDDLHRLAEKAFGTNEWQSRLARDRGVDARTVRRWAKDGIFKPGAAAAIRAYLLSRRMIAVAAASTDPVEPGAGAALRPALDALLSAAVAVGWTEADVLGAVRAWAASGRPGASSPATEEAP